MSLDVTLETGGKVLQQCEHCGGTGKISLGRTEVYSANITHNLSPMAREAGIYEALWKPEEHNLRKARDLIEPLRAGYARLLANPEHFKKFDSPNGWGLYVHFLPFVHKYLLACEENPDADVSVSR